MVLFSWSASRFFALASLALVPVEHLQAQVAHFAARDLALGVAALDPPVSERKES
jgi:hypothetical protein